MRRRKQQQRQHRLTASPAGLGWTGTSTNAVSTKQTQGAASPSTYPHPILYTKTKHRWADEYEAQHRQPRQKTQERQHKRIHKEKKNNRRKKKEEDEPCSPRSNGQAPIPGCCAPPLGGTGIPRWVQGSPSGEGSSPSPAAQRRKRHTPTTHGTSENKNKKLPANKSSYTE